MANRKSMRRDLGARYLLIPALVIVLCPWSSLAQDVGERDELNRRQTNGETTTLAFKDVTVAKLIPFIVESTGKVVIPNDLVMNRRITIVNDEPIPQRLAVDYVFLALQQAGVAVVETADRITLRDIAEIARQDVPVIGPDESVLRRTDFGTVAEKVYALRFTKAEGVHDILEDSIPDYATLAFDEESNQIVVRGNIALLQRVEGLVNALDRESAGALVTETFRLRYADAEQVAENIKELYEDEDSRNQNNNGPGFPRFFQRGGGNQNEDARASSTSENLRVTANTQQNAVTVLAEPSVIEQIRRQIEMVWDQPLAEESVVPKIYDLEHSDPVRVQQLLEGLFGNPTGGQAATGGGGGGGGQGGQGGGNTAPSSGQGAGRLAGQFTFQAIPDAGRLVVVAKSPDNIFVIDQIIAGIDQPVNAGLPKILELKHANAEELSEQLNALLATENTIAQIPRQETGLSESSASSSPFSTTQDDTANDTADTSANVITFWWQRARPPEDSRGASNLVGRLRIVPVWRQNAVMVLAPPEYEASVVELIQSLDRPGRQVLISAVVAEVSLENALSLGLRWSSDAINLTNADNAISLGSTTTGQENDFLGQMFDTSVLDVNADLNLVLQALAQDSNVNILSEPKVFTADNQEAEFFDGQDIPFITDSQRATDGSLTVSTDYRAVGIQLRVRPRITVNRDVDLRVNLELSSIAPTLGVNGQFIVDRRETTTQLIVRDGQTIVVSGILRSEELDVVRKIPLLGDIPIIGALFSSTEQETTNTELVAFITPHVIGGSEDLDQLNAPYRERLDQLREELGRDVERQLGEGAETP